MDKDEKIKELEGEINQLREELCKTKEHLKKYTAPLRNKTYYENNKEHHKSKVKEYQHRINYKSDYKPTPEQKKEYARQAYLNKKTKLKKIEEIKNENENI